MPGDMYKEASESIFVFFMVVIIWPCPAGGRWFTRTGVYWKVVSESHPVAESLTSKDAYSLKGIK